MRKAKATGGPEVTGVRFQVTIEAKDPAALGGSVLAKLLKGVACMVEDGVKEGYSVNETSSIVCAYGFTTVRK